METNGFVSRLKKASACAAGAALLLSSMGPSASAAAAAALSLPASSAGGQAASAGVAGAAFQAVPENFGSGAFRARLLPALPGASAAPVRPSGRVRALRAVSPSASPKVRAARALVQASGAAIASLGQGRSEASSAWSGLHSFWSSAKPSAASLTVAAGSPGVLRPGLSASIQGGRAGREAARAALMRYGRALLQIPGAKAVGIEETSPGRWEIVVYMDDPRAGQASSIFHRTLGGVPVRARVDVPVVTDLLDWAAVREAEVRRAGETGGASAAWRRFFRDADVAVAFHPIASFFSGVMIAGALIAIGLHAPAVAVVPAAAAMIFTAVTGLRNHHCLSTLLQLSQITTYYETVALAGATGFFPMVVPGLIAAWIACRALGTPWPSPGRQLLALLANMFLLGMFTEAFARVVVYYLRP